MADAIYIRVSSESQNTSRQENVPASWIPFIDHCSGKDTNRPALTECLNKWIRGGDILHVHSIDRLARNLVDLENIVSTVTAKGGTVHFIKEGMTFSPDNSNPMNTMLLQVLGSFAQFERAMIKERQREGIAIAKAAGKFKGGTPKITEAEVKRMQEMSANGASTKELCETFGITRPTLYKYLRGQYSRTKDC